MTLKGFGGNNEIGLFDYVTGLVKNKEFTNLKGMIYLTDGYGIFPERKPDYDVAFVFVNDRYEIPEVPPWVIKLILEPNDI
jgi:predicted metal-dependent peptidase